MVVRIGNLELFAREQFWDTVLREFVMTPECRNGIFGADVRWYSLAQSQSPYRSTMAPQRGIHTLAAPAMDWTACGRRARHCSIMVSCGGRTCENVQSGRVVAIHARYFPYRANGAGQS